MNIMENDWLIYANNEKDWLIYANNCILMKIPVAQNGLFFKQK
jgi:hypothetical protein